MKRYAFAILVFGVSNFAFADGDFTKTGAMKIDAEKERVANLHIACSSDRDGGALIIEIIIPDANTKKDFDYDDFEGPDAHAGALSHVEWTTAAGKTSITTSVAGSYIPEPAEAFEFGIDVLSNRHNKGTTLMASIKSDPGKLVWTQLSDDKSKRKLVATFDMDASEAKRLHDVTSACLSK